MAFVASCHARVCGQPSEHTASLRTFFVHRSDARHPGEPGDACFSMGHHVMRHTKNGQARPKKLQSCSWIIRCRLESGWCSNTLSREAER